MRSFLCLAVLCFLMAPARADEPISPDEALKRMQERAEARKKAAATQPAATRPTAHAADPRRPTSKSAADPNAPHEDPIPLAGGKFEFIPPPSGTWDFANQTTDKAASFSTKNHDSAIVIQ